MVTLPRVNSLSTKVTFDAFTVKILLFKLVVPEIVRLPATPKLFGTVISKLLSPLIQALAPEPITN